MRSGARIASGMSTVDDGAHARILENLNSFSIGARTRIESHAREYGLPMQR